MFTYILKTSYCQKINSRNAFGLHLIDYMEEMLKKNGEMTNFQVNRYCASIMLVNLVSC